ncbi:metalloprotease-like protein [Ophiostoma piceae UAMH 11346]|uniref:Metalloprotease-like protein n=1 Tax=Ophiostoma piceae (strain UAMH 11346) TaxID=1262450 RepID=S3C8R2_OPHP1|nr:metalloprotease-like protein [Ophiostoma piceae UAMH 11346]
MARIAHIMLMSYAGLDFTCLHRLPSHVDTEWESDRTTMDLERAGIYNPDVREANVAWNAEVQRVMHFDFDRVSLDYLPDPPTDDEEDQAEPRSETKRVKTEPDAADSGARSPLLSRADANAMDDAVGGHDDDLAKKTLPKAEEVEQCE